MEALDLIRIAIHGRRSVRRGYVDNPVSREWLLDIVAAGAAAPSGSNTQSVRFLVETRPELIRSLAAVRRVAGDVLTAGCAVVLVFVDRDKDLSHTGNGHIWRQLAYQDSAAAIQNMLLMAYGYGLGACWVSAYENMGGTPLMNGKTWADALAAYGLPTSLEIMGVVVLGHVGDPAALRGDTMHRGREVARWPVGHYLVGSYFHGGGA